MAGQGNTAEHELLKAIEQGARNSSLGVSVPNRVGSGGGSLGEQVLAWVASISDGGVKNFFSRARIKKILTILVAIFGFFYLISLTRGILSLRRIPAFELAGVKEAAPMGVVELPVGERDFYIKELVDRNIFVPGTVHTEEVAETEQIRPFLQERASQLKLVGISWSDDSQERYVMLEDMNTRLTYYLKEGDRFLDFSVKDIQQESVIIGFGSEEIELR